MIGFSYSNSIEYRLCEIIKEAEELKSLFDDDCIPEILLTAGLETLKNEFDDLYIQLEA